jgi:hypothetical protein
VACGQGDGDVGAERMGADDHRGAHLPAAEQFRHGIGVTGKVVGAGRVDGTPEPGEVGDDERAIGGQRVVGATPVAPGAREPVQEQHPRWAGAEASMGERGSEVLGAAARGPVEPDPPRPAADLDADGGCGHQHTGRPPAATAPPIGPARLADAD